MVSIIEEEINLKPRETVIRLEALFPQLDVSATFHRFAPFREEDKHQTVFNITRELANGGYAWVLKKNGFYNPKHPEFSGHCHQCTPALGLVLSLLKYRVSYLECYRIREHFTETGQIEIVPPQEESNEAVREEFCSIGRIPYCCLEVMIDGEPRYVSGKHIRTEGDSTLALLTPECYREFSGVFPHQDVSTKSGIYLDSVLVKDL